MIDRARLRSLHDRLVGDDLTASSELFALTAKPLTAIIRKRVAGLSWDEAGDLATDAIVAYVREPERFDPARAGLFGYLLLIAHRDALNLIRSRGVEKKNRQHAVELWAPSGKDQADAANERIDADHVLRNHLSEIVVEAGDEEVLRLFLAGERDTAAYAASLGISHLPEGEQRKIVKLRRDRVDQRLRRLKEVLK